MAEKVAINMKGDSKSSILWGAFFRLQVVQG